MNNKTKIFVSILLLIVLVIAFYLTKSNDKRSKNVISAEDVFYGDYKDGDILDFEGKITDSIIINSSYGQSNLASIFTGVDNFAIMINDNGSYSKGDKIQSTIHFKEYEYNDIKILSGEKIYGLYLLLPSSIEAALFSSQYSHCGFMLNFKTIDENGKTTYEIESKNDSLNLSDFNLKLITMKSTDAGNKNYNQNINASTELFKNEWIYLSALISNALRVNNDIIIDSMAFLDNISSQNGMIHYNDKNNNSKIDTNDTINVTISPTSNKYKIDTYAILISPINEDKDFRLVHYIINWYKGVYTTVLTN